MRYVCCFEACHEQVISVVARSLKLFSERCVPFCRDAGVTLRRLAPLCNVLRRLVLCFEAWYEHVLLVIVSSLIVYRTSCVPFCHNVDAAVPKRRKADFVAISSHFVDFKHVKSK